MAADYTKNARERLIEMIKGDNPKATAVLGDLFLGTPTAVNQHNRNTRLVVTVSPNASIAANAKGKQDEKLHGQRTFFYDRLDLNTFFVEKGLVITGTIATTHDLIDLIMDQLHVNFEPTDIVLQNIVGDNYAITASPNSYGWLGTVTFTAQSTVSGPILLLDGGGMFLLDSGAPLSNN